MPKKLRSFAVLAEALLRCYNAFQPMADWKQITARIRRARTGKDPVGQLSSLYEKTRDAMVAFELARVFETSGQNSDAAKWYMAAAERFRRADWKTKAQEAAVRLGAELSQAAAAEYSSDSQLSLPPAAFAEPQPIEQAHLVASDASPAPTEPSVEAAAEPPASDANATPTRRRRGRRGGRNRRRGETPKSAAPATRSSAPDAAQRDQTDEPRPPRVTHARAIPSLPLEPAAETGAPGVRGRSGDPGLSSRLSALEMQLRRLLTCPPVKLNEADHAPAGPGVFVLTDSDLTSYYYVEACKTLRIAIGGLLRGGASRHGGDSIKPRLAEHLGIPETRVTKYLADHCVVRWLQLDEGASYFAHFVIAVIRPILNE
ncbi:MAG TPA: hypothetical protein VE077_05735 [Candidatus Methylomirabilis sp.]|nr:hypothetical protein [Candidatus Methylomirabilis sp.]